MTPAQLYRQALVSSSDFDRLIMRLNYRVNKNKKKWVEASIKIQSIARVYFAKNVASVLQAARDLRVKKEKKLAAANEALVRRNYVEAINEAEGALEYGKESLDGCRIIGHSFLSLKKFNEAITAYTKALDIKSDHIKCRQGRARCFIILERWEAALEDLAYLIEIDPKNSSHRHFRGLVRAKLNMWQEAAIDFAKAVELGDSSPDAYVRKGMAEASAQRFAAAVDSFTSAIQMDDSYSQAFVLRGRSYCCQRRMNTLLIHFLDDALISFALFPVVGNGSKPNLIL